MATSKVNTTIQTSSKTSSEQLRPIANFPPSTWGDVFLCFSLDHSILEAYAKAIKEPKEDLRRLIINPTISSNEKLSLIYHVCRLGLKYLFTKEIDNELKRLFKELNLKDYDEADLYTISLNFQVFRQAGYKMSCDVFNKFKDCSSNKFKQCITTDVRGTLSFYESTQLRIRGETILEEAFIFTKAQLRALVDTLEGNISQQVKHALSSPIYRGIPMIEARLYFSNYEEEYSTYRSLSTLAKAHFRYLQLLYKEELRILTKWYKDMEFQVKNPYVRDRLPEVYMAVVALFLEPHYSQARIITSKVIQLLVVLDDTYDAYGTIEELRLLTDAINRWEISAMEQLPAYIKPFYKIVMNEYCELERQLTKEGRVYLVNASKQAFQEQTTAYLKEVEWRHSKHTPSFEEYLKNGLITSGIDAMVKSSLVGMGDIVSKEALAWYESRPKILEASMLIGRLHNDVRSFQFEGERGQHVVTSVDAYMKTFGVSKNVAIEKIKEMIENAWEDINEGCLKPTKVSMELLAPIVNIARMTHVAYRHKDEFSIPGKTFNKYINLLFIASIPM